MSGDKLGEFTLQMKNFLIGTTYNVKAFAVNEEDMEGWGPIESFTPSEIRSY